MSTSNNIKTQYISNYNKTSFEAARAKWIGQARKANNGLYMTVIDYDGCNNLTIQFEDGYIVSNIKSSNFNKGKVSHPDYNIRGKHDNKEDTRLGETNVAYNGMTMTIIRYNCTNDIDVQFNDKDKTIVTNKLYQRFKEGAIEHPLYPFTNKPNNDIRIGETKRSSSLGINMTIIDSNNYDDITIRFEDDAIVKHRSYAHFKTGKTSHKFPHQFGNIIMKKLAYINNDIGNFYCKCLQCGHEDIWTITEIKEHICNE